MCEEGALGSFFAGLGRHCGVESCGVDLIFLIALVSLIKVLVIQDTEPSLVGHRVVNIYLNLVIVFVVSFVSCG